MNNSGFDFKYLINPEKATGYWTFPQKAIGEEAIIIDSSAPFAAGAIYSTVVDMYKWHTGLESYKIINKPLLDRAYTPFKNKYGYGWMIDSLFGRRIIHHSGDIWGFKSDIAKISGEDAYIVLLNNIEDPDLGIITKKLISILCNQPYKLPAKNEIILSNELLKKYIGSYEIQPGMVAVLTVENGHLMATTDHKEELYAQRDGFFITETGENQLEIGFEADTTGKIINLFMFKTGQKIICKKIK